MKLKTLILLPLILLVAACTTSLVEPEVSRSIRVVDVAVDTSAMKSGVTGREISISSEQVKRDVQAALKRSLSIGNPQGDPVKVTVRIKSVALVSPGQSLLIGGVSAISGDITVTNLKTGEAVVPTRDVAGFGSGYAPGGVIGALTTKNPQADYENVVNGFAGRIQSGLFNTDSSPSKS